MVRRGVDDALLEGVADDLADAPVRQPLLAGDFRIGPTLAQSREDPRAAQLPQIRVGSPLCGGNRLVIHLNLRFFEPLPVRAGYGETA